LSEKRDPPKCILQFILENWKFSLLRMKKKLNNTYDAFCRLNVDEAEINFVTRNFAPIVNGHHLKGTTIQLTFKISGKHYN
jgi:hypothetical protein